MSLRQIWNRRAFLGSSGTLAGMLVSAKKTFGWTVSQPVAGVPGNLTGFGATGNVYEELGVTTVINGQGTMTVLGGSLVRPEVEAVMALASQHFVSVAELEVAAGKRISHLLTLPDGYSAVVPTGAAAALQPGPAGILTGDKPM